MNIIIPITSSSAFRHHHHCGHHSYSRHSLFHIIVAWLRQFVCKEDAVGAARKALFILKKWSSRMTKNCYYYVITTSQNLNVFILLGLVVGGVGRNVVIDIP